MTFRRTPYVPYDTTGWTASPEVPEIGYRAARARRPQDGVPLRRPTETGPEYTARLAEHEALDVEFVDDDPIQDHAPVGYDESDFWKE